MLVGALRKTIKLKTENEHGGAVGLPSFHCATSSADPNNSLIMILTGHKTRSSCGCLFCTMLESQIFEMEISDIMETGSRGTSHHHHHHHIAHSKKYYT